MGVNSFLHNLTNSNDGTSGQYVVKVRLLTSENEVNDNKEDPSQEVHSSHIFRTRALQHLMYSIQLILVSISSFILYCIYHLNHVSVIFDLQVSVYVVSIPEYSYCQMM